MIRSCNPEYSTGGAASQKSFNIEWENKIGGKEAAHTAGTIARLAYSL
ncbi:MAG: hypothetical protein JO066_04225 [Verrucomicrobia bacterium]|nr:hypothetical protein [Verrucomicrobiota bacterium]